MHHLQLFPDTQAGLRGGTWREEKGEKGKRGEENEV